MPFWFGGIETWLGAVPRTNRILTREPIPLSYRVHATLPCNRRFQPSCHSDVGGSRHGWGFSPRTKWCLYTGEHARFDKMITNNLGGKGRLLQVYIKTSWCCRKDRVTAALPLKRLNYLPPIYIIQTYEVSNVHHYLNISASDRLNKMNTQRSTPTFRDCPVLREHKQISLIPLRETVTFADEKEPFTMVRTRRKAFFFNWTEQKLPQASDCRQIGKQSLRSWPFH